MRGVDIPSRFTKSDWFPIVVAFLLPAALLLIVLAAPTQFRDQVRRFASDHWGDLASAWGLLVSFYVLFVAKGARTAAREARLRTALEVLEDAADKCGQIGQFAQQGNWSITSLLATEVKGLCHSTMARWEKDDALQDSRNDLFIVTTEMGTILDETDKQAPRKKAILTAQRNSADKLTAVVGRMQGKEESRST